MPLLNRTVVTLLILLLQVQKFKSHDSFDFSGSLQSNNNATNTYDRILCPVTSLFDLKTDGYFIYPVDLFEPQLYKHLMIQKSLRSDNNEDPLHSKLYNCTSQLNIHGRDAPHPKHLCTIGVNRKCPINQEFIPIVLRKSLKWLSPTTQSIPFLYHIWMSMMNRHAIIRVIVMGGSGARGSEAGGCYCNPLLDSKCTAFDHNAFKRSRTTDFDMRDPDCRWSTFFIKWLRTVSDAEIKPIYLTEGGNLPVDGTYFMQDNFIPSKLGAFTRNDVLIFDYSMNEAFSYGGTPEGSYNHILVLERAIRTVFALVDEKETVPPTVILTETFSARCRKHCDRSNMSKSYTLAYDTIASYYNLAIFSFIDVLETIENHHDKYLHKVLRVTSQHPLWYNHLFFADLFASVFASELRRCYDFALFHGTKLVQQRIDAMPLVSKVIRNPLSPEVDNEALCDNRVPPLLDISAADFLAKQQSTHFITRQKNPSVGWYSVHPTNISSAWNLVEEKGEKYGWKDEFEGADDKIERVLRLYLDDRKGSLFGKDKLLLFVKYIRSYYNAGRVRMHVCGQNPHQQYGFEMFANTEFYRNCYLDSLWENYRTNKISIPEYYTKELQPSHAFSKEKCDVELKNQLKAVNVTGVDGKMNGIKKEIDLKSVGTDGAILYPYLDIIHERMCETDNDDFGRCEARKPVEKVKIISFKICKSKNGLS